MYVLILPTIYKTPSFKKSCIVVVMVPLLFAKAHLCLVRCDWGSGYPVNTAFQVEWTMDKPTLLHCMHSRRVKFHPLWGCSVANSIKEITDHSHHRPRDLVR